MLSSARHKVNASHCATCLLRCHVFHLSHNISSRMWVPSYRHRNQGWGIKEVFSMSQRKAESKTFIQALPWVYALLPALPSYTRWFWSHSSGLALPSEAIPVDMQLSLGIIYSLDQITVKLDSPKLSSTPLGSLNYCYRCMYPPPHQIYMYICMCVYMYTHMHKQCT